MVAVAERRTAKGWAAHNGRMRELAIERGASIIELERTKRLFLVESSSTAGRRYDVRVDAAGGFAVVTCNCPAGSSQAPLGSTPCHHGAAGCLWMERAGLLAWTGELWFMTQVASARVRPPAPEPPAVRNPCRLCGSEVDGDCLIPVEQQEVIEPEGKRHRGCKP